MASFGMEESGVMREMRGRGGGGEEWGMRDEEEKRCVRDWGLGLKTSGPRTCFDERRSGGVNTDKIGNTDFHSDDSSILRRGFAEAQEKLHENSGRRDGRVRV